MAIIHPLKPRMGAGLVLTVIAIIWVVSIAIAVPNLLYAQTYRPAGYYWVQMATSVGTCLRHHHSLRDVGGKMHCRREW